MSHHPTSARRAFFRHACCGSLGLAASVIAAPSFAADAKKTTLTADQALARLKEGNADFLRDSPLRTAHGRDRRLEIARGQTPFAVLVSCSDSRVPPEVLFGRGLGELAFPPDYPKMPGEPSRVQPSRARPNPLD